MTNMASACRNRVLKSALRRTASFWVLWAASVNKDKLYNQLLAAAVAFILLNALAFALGLLNVFG